MKVLFDINHPAHVHLFKNVIAELERKNFKVYVAAKDSIAITTLLELYKINYIVISKKKDTLFLKYLFEFRHIYKLYRMVKRHKIDFGLGISMALPFVSKITKMKSFCFDDDDVKATPVFARSVSFANTLFNPGCLAYEQRGRNRICHESYHELAYLHPNRFKPDPTILGKLGINKNEKFFLMRFNAFKAHHDIKAAGLNMNQKLELISILKPYGKVFVSTEEDTEPELKEYQIPLSPDNIHSLLYLASMFIGDSQTMTTEAAVLGTPALKLNTFSGILSVPNEIQNKYQLCYSYQPTEYDKLVLKVKELLNTVNLKEEWNIRKNKMLADKIDLTSFIVWFIEFYPESKTIMKENPDYQNNFR